MTPEVVSIVIVGVGGQGILLGTQVAARAALAAGFDVKTNEVHGMAQRGGSVVAQLRFGPRVFSPLVPEGTARVLGSLERIEAVYGADHPNVGVVMNNFANLLRELGRLDESEELPVFYRTGDQFGDAIHFWLFHAKAGHFLHAGMPVGQGFTAGDGRRAELHRLIAGRHGFQGSGHIFIGHIEYYSFHSQIFIFSSRINSGGMSATLSVMTRIRELFIKLSPHSLVNDHPHAFRADM